MTVECSRNNDGTLSYLHVQSGRLGQPGSPLGRGQDPSSLYDPAQLASHLWGVSNYFDRDTMRFFSCRVVDMLVRSDLCAVFVLTSQAAGPSRDHGRECRIVQITYWVAGPSCVVDDERFSTLRAARKAFKEYAK